MKMYVNGPGFYTLLARRGCYTEIISMFYIWSDYYLKCMPQIYHSRHCECILLIIRYSDKIMMILHSDKITRATPTGSLGGYAPPSFLIFHFILGLVTLHARRIWGLLPIQKAAEWYLKELGTHITSWIGS